MKLLTGRTETWKSSFCGMDVRNQGYLWWPYRGWKPKRRAAALLSHFFPSENHSGWSLPRHVKPSKTEGMIIALGKNLKTKSPFYHSRRDESVVLGPGSHCYGSRMEGHKRFTHLKSFYNVHRPDILIRSHIPSYFRSSHLLEVAQGHERKRGNWEACEQQAFHRAPSLQLAQMEDTFPCLGIHHP